MALKMIGHVAALLLLVAGPVHAITIHTNAQTNSKEELRLHELERAHQKSMTAMMANMTLHQAMQVLATKSTTQAKEVMQLVKAVQSQQASTKNLRASSVSSEEAAETSRIAALRLDASVDVIDESRGTQVAKSARQPGYSGVDKAKDMLNEMIEETQKKYDLEIQKCCEYDDMQSVLIEEARQDISNFNAEAAEARKEIADAKSHIEICETKLPELGDALYAHNIACHDEIFALNTQLSIVNEDLAVMATILGMTDCDSKIPGQKMMLLSCKDECTGESFVTFADEGLKNTHTKMKSEETKQLVSESLSEAYGQMPFFNMSNTTTAPPLPRMSVKRSGPCKTPVASDKRQGKCSMNSNPNCPKMQEKFLYIQEGIVDKRDELMQQISKLEADCESLKMQLESQIQYFETQLKDKQTELAAGTKKQNNAEEQSRLKSKELSGLLADYDGMTTVCHANYATLEGEECGLKKIRGELYKMKGQDNPAFFQDCIVSEWRPGECSASCAGGYLMLERSIVTHPVGGSKCPILQASKPCNEHKCPIDCKLFDWEEWSACTTKCGGGLMERARKTEVEPEHGGDPCGATTEADSCNLQSCDKDCELADWEPWTKCSKDCDSGTTQRQKQISVQLVGDGACPKMDSDLRHQQKFCNEDQCLAPPGEKTLLCASRVDLTLMLDGSGSLGQSGWDGGLMAAEMITHAMAGGKKGDVMMALMVFSAKTEIIEHYTDDLDKVIDSIKNLKFPQSITRTAVALDTARSELSLGRPDAQSVVLVVTDGKPMSMLKTRQASLELRKQTRLMWIPVTKYAPVAAMRKWASNPKSDNFLALEKFSDLEDPANMDKIISDVCPKVTR